MPPLLEETPRGLYCRLADVYIDPWEPVERAVITHAHADHARPGMRHYLTVTDGAAVLQDRMGPDADIQAIEYGEPVVHNGVRLTLHGAGHILGSCQVRLEHQGQVWVVSGDYKTAPDPTCRPLEPLKCHGFVTESTFGLPIYRWKEPADLLDDIHAWWREGQERGRTCVLFAYALGKAQRVLCQLDPAVGPILVHGAVDRYLNAYQTAGISLPPTERVTDEIARATRGRALVIAPPSAQGSIWIRKFGEISTAVASGWMQIRGTRRRKAVDRGFPLSDHADWDGLRATIEATGAEEVWVTHGYSQVMARWLSEQGRAARPIATRFEGETETAMEGEVSEDVTGSQVSTSASSDSD